MPRPDPDPVARFATTERWVHRSTALLVGVLFATGFTLYYEPLTVLVSRRALVETTHIVTGLLLPLPMLLGLLTSPELRHDVSVLGRMTHVDRLWLALGPSPGGPAGGQVQRWTEDRRGHDGRRRPGAHRHGGAAPGPAAAESPGQRARGRDRDPRPLHVRPVPPPCRPRLAGAAASRG